MQYCRAVLHRARVFQAIAVRVHARMLCTGGEGPPLLEAPPRRLDDAAQTATEGQLVTLLHTSGRKTLLRLRAGVKENGIVHNTVIGQRFGAVISTQSKSPEPLLVLQPTLEDVLRTFKHCTQVVYPKDAAYVCFHLGLRPGSIVLEAGTGSGYLTTILAWHVLPGGQVYTFDVRAEHQQIAQANWQLAGITNGIQCRVRDVATDGFDERNADAVVLDAREPATLLAAAHAALRPGGSLGCVMATVNQVVDVLRAMQTDSGWVDVRVEELLRRPYRPLAARLRPDDLMHAHTAFLLFARSAPREHDLQRWAHPDEQAYRRRKREL